MIYRNLQGFFHVYSPEFKRPGYGNGLFSDFIIRWGNESLKIIVILYIHAKVMSLIFNLLVVFKGIIFYLLLCFHFELASFRILYLKLPRPFMIKIIHGNF